MRDELIMVTQTEHKEEPILQHNPLRFSLFPIVYQDVFDRVKQLQASMWTADVIDLDTDKLQMESGVVSKREVAIVKYILAFFNAADGIVLENLIRFMREIENPEIRMFYAGQMYQESVHQEIYARLGLCYAKDKAEQEKMFDIANNADVIKDKAKFAEKWMNAKAPFVQRLVAFIFVEALHFCTSFCIIVYLYRKRKFPGLGESNEYIRRDETMHWEFGCLVYRKLKYTGLSDDEVHRIAEEAIEVERKFIKGAFELLRKMDEEDKKKNIKRKPDDLDGLTEKQMQQYAEYVVDLVLKHMDHKPKFGTKNPCTFMETMSMPRKSNFIEKHVSEYQIFQGKQQKFTTDLPDF